MREFVHGVKDRREFIEKMKRVKGEDYFDKLRIRKSVWSEPIDTGV